MSTAIPYLDEVWNVTTGCGDDIVSPGCEHCYARRMFGRNLWKCPRCHGTGVRSDSPLDGGQCGQCHGTGKATFTPTFHADRLEQPLHWRKPRRIGVSFMGDLFHEAITDEQIIRVFLAMIENPQHTYLLLTKRPERMRNTVKDWQEALWTAQLPSDEFPPDNWHLGVTVTSQEEADRLVPLLLDTPAAVRWVSLEPMLEPVDMENVYNAEAEQLTHEAKTHYNTLSGVSEPYIGYPHLGAKLDLVVLGGETGPGARPMQPEWALDVYRQCKAAGVALWFKQSGAWLDRAQVELGPTRWNEWLDMQATHELAAVTP